MLKLGRAEQVAILAAVQRFPEDKHLGQWLTTWVRMQVAAGTDKGIDIRDIPIVISNGPGQKQPHKSKEEIDAIINSTGYQALDKPQRRAVRKYMNATIIRIEETDRFPEKDECWLGDHPFSEDAFDSPLWIVVIKYGDSGEEKGRWGCEACAKSIQVTHPELKNA